jgi:hypothetical protein
MVPVSFLQQLWTPETQVTVALQLNLLLQRDQPAVLLEGYCVVAEVHTPSPVAKMLVAPIAAVQNQAVLCQAGALHFAAST